jgi:DNA-binding transcriptional MerR regulator
MQALLLTIQQMAFNLGVHPQTLRRWERQGRMSFQLRTELARNTKAKLLSPEEWARQHQVKLRSHQLKELQQMAAAHKA